MKRNYELRITPGPAWPESSDAFDHASGFYDLGRALDAMAKFMKSARKERKRIQCRLQSFPDTHCVMELVRVSDGRRLAGISKSATGAWSDQIPPRGREIRLWWSDGTERPGSVPVVETFYYGALGRC